MYIKINSKRFHTLYEFFLTLEAPRGNFDLIETFLIHNVLMQSLFLFFLTLYISNISNINSKVNFNKFCIKNLMHAMELK